MIYSMMAMIDNIMTKEECQKLAKAILLAQDIREISWDDKDKKYTKTQKDAAEEAVAKVYHVMYLSCYIAFIEDLNGYHWNGIQEWAQTILNIKGEMK